MWVYFLHAMFAACLVCLLWAMNNATEKQELLIKGLELARRAEADAARVRLARQFDAQSEAIRAMQETIDGAQCAIRRSESVLQGSVRVRGACQPVGHEAKKAGE